MNPAPMNILWAMPGESSGGGFLAGALAKAHQGDTLPGRRAAAQHFGESPRPSRVHEKP